MSDYYTERLQEQQREQRLHEQRLYEQRRDEQLSQERLNEQQRRDAEGESRRREQSRSRGRRSRQRIPRRVEAFDEERHRLAREEERLGDQQRGEARRIPRRVEAFDEERHRLAREDERIRDQQREEARRKAQRDQTPGPVRTADSEARSHQPSAEAAKPIVLGTGRSRADAIIGNTSGRIEIAENPGVKSSPYPWYSRTSAQEVTTYESVIESAAQRNGLDPDLAKAVVWTESTHGWYDSVTGIVKAPKTLRPMNVHVEFWRNLGVTRESLSDPRINIETGVYILSSIASRVENPTPEKILTLYNNLSADKVSEYGKTAGQYYREKPWARMGR